MLLCKTFSGFNQQVAYEVNMRLRSVCFTSEHHLKVTPRVSTPVEGTHFCFVATIVVTWWTSPPTPPGSMTLKASGSLCIPGPDCGCGPPNSQAVKAQGSQMVEHKLAGGKVRPQNCPTAPPVTGWLDALVQFSVSHEPAPVHSWQSETAGIC